jgi:hypothetical protein
MSVDNWSQNYSCNSGTESNIKVLVVAVHGYGSINALLK